MMFPTVPLGTLSAESIRICGIVPTEGVGLLCRGMDVFLAVEQAPGPTDHWLIEVGTVFGNGDFEVRGVLAGPAGIAKGRNPIEFGRKVRYTTGEIVAVRARPVGAPSSLAGCDVVLRLQEA